MEQTNEHIPSVVQNIINAQIQTIIEAQTNDHSLPDEQITPVMDTLLEDHSLFDDNTQTFDYSQPEGYSQADGYSQVDDHSQLGDSSQLVVELAKVDKSKAKAAKTQSAALRTRIKTMHDGGQHFNDDSKHSEDRLTSVIQGKILPHARARIEKIGGAVVFLKQISLYDVMEIFAQHNPNEEIDNCEENKKVYMKPDGGILIAIIDGKSYPILLTEDKLQGTNDERRAQGLARQATGNAIERAAKNIRGAEMLFCASPVFPYVLFASGCDLHSSETISKRLEMMNYGVKNHYIEMSTIEQLVEARVAQMLDRINIAKRFGGKCVASMFVKAHKWDEMTHGASAWSIAEIEAVCMRVVDAAIDALPKQ